MSYLVLARKYRPGTFAQVVHQDHVTLTLSNAIRAGRLAHAILFSGPRGTGKTTIARILAKAMNCAEGPTPEPCNRCRSCLEITGGNAADVYEIDGASNNGVEQVRELRENLKYMPNHSRYKIYIIDEVHMLSTGAFNALLKTLEEPPAHVLFFFATTEPHKIPATILSRCQRHDLKRIPTRAIAAYLEDICRQEGRQVATAGLETIAREADGCLRDGLSLLDQVLAGADGEVDAGQVQEVLGIFDRAQLMQLADAVLARDWGAILDAVAAAYSQGMDLRKFYQDLCEQFRHMLVIRTLEKAEALVELPEAELAAIGSQVAGVSPALLSQTLDFLLREDSFVRLAPQPRLAVETVLARLVQVPPPLTIDALVAKLDTLRSQSADRQGAMPASPEPAGASSPASRAAPDTVDSPVEERLFDCIRQSHPKLAGVLAHCRIKAVNAADLVMEVGGNGFHAGLLRKNTEAIEAVCGQVLGRRLKLVLETPPRNRSDDSARQRRRRNAIKQEALGHPLVSEAIELFNGQVMDVRVLEAEHEGDPQ
ncbi:MAG TPA: DNA polymerase III subunit gamma/tau [Desulfobacteraceae bacterium]|nr:DNA polymerase III subunit gamma/tau [Desulfobacteraceae bacterium]